MKSIKVNIVDRTKDAYGNLEIRAEEAAKALKALENYYPEAEIEVSIDWRCNEGFRDKME